MSGAKKEIVKQLTEEIRSSEIDSDEDDDGDIEESSGGMSLSSSGVTGSSSKEQSSTGGSANDAKELRDRMKNEEKAVFKSKVMVAIAILCCSIAVTVAVFLLTRRNDVNNFELEYEAQVTDIKKLVRWEMRYNFALVEQLSASITTAAKYLNSTFPFHTESEFELASGFVDGMGGIMSAGYAPLVTLSQLDQWSDYSVKNQGWIEDSARIKEVHPIHRDAMHGTFHDHEHDRRLEEEGTPEQITPVIFKWENGEKVREGPKDLYAPLWQISPATYDPINVNLLSDPRMADLYRVMLNRNQNGRDLGVLSSHTEITDTFDFLFDPEEKENKKDAHAFLMQPVYDKIAHNSTIVGLVVAVTTFGNLLDYILAEGESGIIGVLKDNCGHVMSFELSHRKTAFLGYTDKHDTSFDEYERIEYDIEQYGEYTEGLCTHDLYLYPTEERRNAYMTDKPIVYSTLVAVAFLAVIALFTLYDFMVTRRQNKALLTALNTQKIVTALFPKDVGRRIIREAQEQQQDKSKGMVKGKNGSEDEPESGSNDRIAEFYPETSVCFLDMVGFTAWSSMREPQAVFQLLETLYSAFDNIANRRRVFKVETIGDCYMSVCGLPQKRKNHHIIMARFASDCLQAVGPILAGLEVELGPDTADLGVRVGISSGPVTAGVLRGDRARYQLFGDTVNTAARMESTGQKNKIHLSQVTAKKLIADGKGHWLNKREDLVHAKGKGDLETYWLKSSFQADTASSSGGRESDQGSFSPQADTAKSVKLPEVSNSDSGLDPRAQRLVEWNTDMLSRSLGAILASRQAAGTIADPTEAIKKVEESFESTDNIVLDELKEVITLPKFDASAAQRAGNKVEVSSRVRDQLHHYVASLASKYRNNEFHNFEHASHVTMSTTKLLTRITAPEGNDLQKNTLELHDHTFGLTSDPLTQFTVVLSALMHDVDHQGVTNAQLVKEGADVASQYRNKSVAEQNSVDISWELLMQDCYEDLRHAIYCTKEELYRFRQLLVNVVLATDIADKELKNARNERWAKAFAGECSNNQDKQEDTDRKATIVLEHIIQASDVSHTMQHWHVYKKWNKRLFMELYNAHKAGRMEANPAEFWVKGEVGFFDFYIIPLAKKLGECGVFGVSGDEYLNYAMNNRAEWLQKGESVLEEYLEEIKASEH